MYPKIDCNLKRFALSSNNVHQWSVVEVLYTYCLGYEVFVGFSKLDFKVQFNIMNFYFRIKTMRKTHSLSILVGCNGIEGRNGHPLS